MAGTFDSVLNFIIPALIILIVIGFAWTKLIEPALWPFLKNMLGIGKEAAHDAKYGKEIVYD